MAATSRFVLFDIDAETDISIDSSDPDGNGLGSRGYAESNTAAPDTITIQQGVNDSFQINIDGNGFQSITVTSGTDLDARFIAQEIAFKMKQLVSSEFDFSGCEYVNNRFRIWSSTMGSGSTVAVNPGTNDLSDDLNLTDGVSSTATIVNGSNNGNSGTYVGTFTVSGVYTGQFDDMYTVIFGDDHPVGNVTPDGGNTYAGTATSAGDWNESSAETYTITVDGSTNPTMNAGTGNVPTFTYTSTLGDNSASATELLYADYWYEIGTKGLRIKFSDAPFGASDEFDIVCTPASGSVAAPGTAQYHWSSRREGKSSSPTVTSASGVGTRIGTRGIEGLFSTGSNLSPGDEFRVIATGPQPTTLGVTTLNYGPVTVSTYSPVKAVWFELMSGATILSNTRFGLQSDGTAQHHNAGNSDTLFGFGTVGAGDSAGTNPQVQTEWRTSVTATDISSDTPPDYLSATEDNLSVVSTASASEVVGVGEGKMVSDFIYLAVKLGATETGANPSIVYRMFFDFA